MNLINIDTTDTRRVEIQTISGGRVEFKFLRLSEVSQLWLPEITVYLLGQHDVDIIDNRDPDDDYVEAIERRQAAADAADPHFDDIPY